LSKPKLTQSCRTEEEEKEEEEGEEEEEEERRPVRKADNFTTILCRCHEIWEP